jgi:hypothetical protein
MYIGSYDNGLTWERPTQLNPFEMIAKNITIGLYGKDKLMTVWWNINDDSIYYQISDNLGKNWSLPIKLPGVKGIWEEHQARLDDYSIATDANGNLHLVFVGLVDNRVDTSGLPTLDPTLPTPTPTLTPTPQPTPTGIIPTEDLRRRTNLLYMNWTDGKWSKPEILSSYVGDVPEWPRIAVGLGNQLHVVWFVRADKDVWNGGGDYTIYYASKKVSVPQFTPVKLPTIVPIVPTKEATEVVETLTPTPVMDLPIVEQKPTWSLVYKEMDYLSVAVITALPVVFFIGIFALILRKLRR